MVFFVNDTFGTSMKLGLAVEMRPRVFSEQFTNCDRMSHAASADSVLLSTWQVQTKIEFHIRNMKRFDQTVLVHVTNTKSGNIFQHRHKSFSILTLKLTYCRWLECLFMICLMRSGCVAFR